jgi:hypothetical protein
MTNHAQRNHTHPEPQRHSTGRGAVLFTIVLLAVSLVAASCGDDIASGSGDLAISIVSPTDGVQVGRSFDVQLTSSVPIGEPDTGRHHVHLYYDGETAEGEYDIVYGNTFTVDHLSPGQHQIEAVIANADHSVTDARQAITVTVADGPASATPPSTASTDSSGGGISGY